MQCNSCGAELPPEARNCPNCGTAVFASSPFEKTTLSSPGMQPEGTLPATSYPSGSFQEMAWPPPQTQPDKPFQANPYPYTPGTPRSEEHTSELQSQSNLVCRLLLEK